MCDNTKGRLSLWVGGRAQDQYVHHQAPTQSTCFAAAHARMVGATRQPTRARRMVRVGWGISLSVTSNDSSP